MSKVTGTGSGEPPGESREPAAEGASPPEKRIRRRLHKDPPVSVGKTTATATSLGPLGTFKSRDKPILPSQRQGPNPAGETPAKTLLSMAERLLREPEAFAEPPKKGFFRSVFKRAREVSRQDEVTGRVRDMARVTERAHFAGQALSRASEGLDEPLAELRAAQAALKDVQGQEQRVDDDRQRLRRAERLSGRLEQALQADLQALQRDGVVPAGLPLRSFDLRFASSARWLPAWREWGGAANAEREARTRVLRELTPEQRGTMEAMKGALSAARAAAAGTGAGTARTPIEALQGEPGRSPALQAAVDGWATAAGRRLRAEQAAMDSVLPGKAARPDLDDPRALQLCRNVLDCARAIGEEATAREAFRAHGDGAEQQRRRAALDDAQQRVARAEQALAPALQKYAAARGAAEEVMHPQAIFDTIRGYMVAKAEEERRLMAEKLIELHAEDLTEAARPGDNGSLGHLKRRQAAAQAGEAKAREQLEAADQERAALLAGEGRPEVRALRKAGQKVVRAKWQLAEAQAQVKGLDAKLDQARADLRDKAGALDEAAYRLAAAGPMAHEQAEAMKLLAEVATDRKDELTRLSFVAMCEHPPGFSPERSTKEEWEQLQTTVARMLDRLPADDPTEERETPRVLKGQVLLRNLALASGHDAKRATGMLDAVMDQQPRHWMRVPDEPGATPPTVEGAAARERQLERDVAGWYENMVDIERGIAFMGDIAKEDNEAGFDPVATYFRARRHERSEPDEASRELNRRAMRHASDIVHGRLADPPEPSLDRAAYGAVAQGYVSKAAGSAYEKVADGLAEWSDDQDAARADMKPKHAWSHRSTVKALRAVQEALGRHTATTHANDALHEAAGKLTWAARRGVLMPESSPATAAQADADHAVLATLGRYLTQHGQRHGRASSWMKVSDALHITTRSFNRHKDLCDPQARLRAVDFKRILEAAAGEEYADLRKSRGEAEGRPAPDVPFKMSAGLEALLRPQGQWKERGAVELLDTLGRHFSSRAVEPIEDIYHPARLNETVLKGARYRLKTSEQRLAEATDMIHDAEERWRVTSGHGKGVGIAAAGAVTAGVLSAAFGVRAEVVRTRSVDTNMPSFGGQSGTAKGLEGRVNLNANVGPGLNVGEGVKVMPISLSARGNAEAGLTDTSAVRAISGKRKKDEVSELAIGERKVDERNQVLAELLEHAAHWRQLDVADGDKRVLLSDPLQAVLAFRPEAPVFAEHRTRKSGTVGAGVDTGASVRFAPEAGARVGGGIHYTGAKAHEGAKDTLQTREAVRATKHQGTLGLMAGLSARIQVDKPEDQRNAHTGGQGSDDNKVKGAFNVPLVGAAISRVVAQSVHKATKTRYNTNQQKYSGSRQLEVANPRKVEKALKNRAVDALLRVVDANKLQEEQTHEDLLRLGMDQYEAFMDRFGTMKRDVNTLYSLKDEQRPARTGDAAGFRALEDTHRAEGRLHLAAGAQAALRELEREPDFWTLKTAAIKHTAAEVSTKVTPPIRIGLLKKSWAIATAVYPGQAFPAVRGLPGEVHDQKKGHLQFKPHGVQERRTPLEALAPEPPPAAETAERSGRTGPLPPIEEDQRETAPGREHSPRASERGSSAEPPEAESSSTPPPPKATVGYFTQRLMDERAAAEAKAKSKGENKETER